MLTASDDHILSILHEILDNNNPRKIGDQRRRYLKKDSSSLGCFWPFECHHYLKIGPTRKQRMVLSYGKERTNQILKEQRQRNNPNKMNWCCGGGSSSDVSCSPVSSVTNSSSTSDSFHCCVGKTKAIPDMKLNVPLTPRLEDLKCDEIVHLLVYGHKEGKSFCDSSSCSSGSGKALTPLNF